MSPVLLRELTPADFPAVCDIYADAVEKGTASYEIEAPLLDELAARFDALLGGGFPCLAAEDAGAVIGYAYAGPFRPRPAYRFIVENSIYLAPSAQGRGIGRMLLADLIDRTAALGFRQMIAVIGDGSAQSASVKLHERMGFRHCGVMQGTGYKFGRWLDTVVMQLAMNGGDETPPDPQSLPERRFRGEA